MVRVDIVKDVKIAKITFESIHSSFFWLKSGIQSI